MKHSSQDAQNYDFLDQAPLVQEMYLHQSPESATVEWHLPSIHCPSCVRLLEDWPQKQEGLDRVRVDFSQKKAQIRFDPRVLSLRQVAERLRNLGHPPDLSMAAFQNPAGNAALAPDRRAWMELGMAGFVFGNTMLFALPEYMGLNSASGIAALLRVLTALLSLPVVFYSARSYFVGAWAAMRQGQATMDVPIALGILALAGQSWLEVGTGAGPGYFDSLAGLVFFLLLGRWFQNASYARLDFERDYRHFFPFSVLRIQPDGKEQHIPIYQIVTGDSLRIRQGETVPVDGLVQGGRADLDLAFITGESLTRHVQEGAEVPAGARVVLGSLEVKARKSLNQSYLTSLWSYQSDSVQRPPMVKWLDALGKRFTLYVLTVTLLALVYWLWADPSQALWVVTSVLIVACPCALSLAIPFGLGNVLRRMATEGALLKSTDTVVQWTRVTDWVFDKTGTLTETQALNWIETDAPEASVKAMLAEVCSRSAHPLSRSLAAHWRQNAVNVTHGEKTPHLVVEAWSEEAGKGISAQVNGYAIRVGSSDWVQQEVDTMGAREGGVSWWVQGVGRGHAVPEGTYREGLGDALRALADQGKRLHLISGDQDRERSKVEALFPPGTVLLFGQSPTDKLHYIQKLQREGSVVGMVGDGLNDAGALAQADLGLTVAEDALQFTPACDALIPGKDLHRLPLHAGMAVRGVRVVRLTMLLSLIYNLLGVGIAVQGLLTPVVSAILMPLSSVSVVLVVLWGSSRAGRASYTTKQATSRVVLN